MHATQTPRTHQSISASMRRTLLALAITLATLGLVSTAQGASIVVDDLGDTSGVNCTLRDAIASANTDTAVAGCVAGGSTDTISFDPSILPGTIILGSELLITAGVTIQGSMTDRLVISANNGSRIFNIDDGFNNTNVSPVTLERLTLSDGNTSGEGGAIRNRDVLIVNACTLTGNNAVGGGGGIANDGGVVTITNSTLSANSATSFGGGVLNDGGGTIRLTNNTLSGNTAGITGGGFHNDGGSSGVLINNIIANSIGGSDCSSGNFLAPSGNLVEDLSCINNQAIPRSGDPQLGPLQDNGGPTHTFAPSVTSGAFDALAGGNCPATDQRGENRDLGACDIGALELQLPPQSMLVVNTLLDTVGDDGQCSLREAEIAARTGAPSGMLTGECDAGFREVIISFDPSIVPGVITLDTEILISSSLTIQGPGADLMTLSGGGNSRIFQLRNTQTAINVTLDGLTFSDGFSDHFLGGAILSYVNLTINESILSGNIALRGGAIAHIGEAATEVLTLTNNTFTGNSAEGGESSNVPRAGAILMRGFDTLIMNNNTVSGNNAGSFGNDPGSFAGGILADGNAFLTNNTVTNNTLTNTFETTSGVGVFSTGNLHLTNNIISGHVGNDCRTGSLLTNINNLIDDGNCTTNQVNLLSGDPLLGPLQDNGGTTPTHAVLPGSPVIDAGDQATCDSVPISFDQTGMPRPIDGNSDTNAICDIGAFEFADIFGPQAILDSAPDVIAPGDTSYELVITYIDDAPIDQTSFDTGDISVTPGPLNITGASSTGNTVTYTLTPPGGSWDVGDNGSYSIALNANQIFDLAITGANAGSAAMIGNFNVAIAEIDVTGNGTSIVNGDTTPDAADGTNFGNVTIAETRVRTFTISNAGLSTINITNPVSIIGAGFSVSQPASTVLGAGVSTHIAVSFSPNVLGSVIGTLIIPNDDPDEGTYLFNLAGNGAIVGDVEIFSNGFE